MQILMAGPKFRTKTAGCHEMTEEETERIKKPEWNNIWIKAGLSVQSEKNVISNLAKKEKKGLFLLEMWKGVERLILRTLQSLAQLWSCPVFYEILDTFEEIPKADRLD